MILALILVVASALAALGTCVLCTRYPASLPVALAALILAAIAFIAAIASCMEMADVLGGL